MTTRTRVRDIEPAAQNNVNAEVILLDKAPAPGPARVGSTCVCLAADDTAAVHLQLWGEECEAFEAGDILRLTNGIFSYTGNGLVLRAGKRGRLQKVGEFTMPFVETPNISEIRWVPHPSIPGKFVQDGVVSPHSRIFPPLP